MFAGRIACLVVVSVPCRRVLVLKEGFGAAGVICFCFVCWPGGWPRPFDSPPEPAENGRRPQKTAQCQPKISRPEPAENGRKPPKTAQCQPKISPPELAENGSKPQQTAPCQPKIDGSLPRFGRRQPARQPSVADPAQGPYTHQTLLIYGVWRHGCHQTQ